MSSPVTPAQVVVTPSKVFYQGKRKRNSVDTRSATKSPPDFKPPCTPVRPPQRSPPKKKAKVKHEAMEKNGKEKKDVIEEPYEKIKLEAILEKTRELQGYVNQLQDAVTIAMCQLRDLKKDVAVTLGSTDKR